MMRLVDAFTAPSKHLLARFIADTGLPASRFHYLPYGFSHSRLRGRTRPLRSPAAEPLVFAFIGRHVPAKGLNLLVQAAFSLLQRRPHALGTFRVLIFGRADGENTASVKRLVTAQVAAAAARGVDAGTLVEFRPEYDNTRIVTTVFDVCDCIVVPSVWSENAPLVIHEAQQLRVPVIASDAPGMAEFVTDGVNGLLFPHRSGEGLSAAMERALAMPPEALAALGARGYLAAEDGNVPCIDATVAELARVYEGVLQRPLGTLQ